MDLKELFNEYPEQFFNYVEKVLDSYFGNIFVTYKNEKILYVNSHMANSVHMTKEELTGMTLEDLREKKLWLRSVSSELYNDKKIPFNAYNVSKWGDELFTHIEPIFNSSGQLIMSAHFSIPKQLLSEFSSYIDSEKSNFKNYKYITEYLETQKGSANTIICESPAAKLTFQDAKFFGTIDGTVLICGETGSGKDVVANYIYHNSKRRNYPFIPVNCSAIPEELMESEFFGYEKGAFTGARVNGKPGLFEMANKGILFLDEIGELPLTMQAKLLRVLETGEFMRVGGTKFIKTDVRIIAATNRNLRQFVAENKFREDLYYRLNVMSLYIPPLRERYEDILPMAKFFLARNNKKYNLNRELTPESCQSLQVYDWPGNVRELRNIIERYAVTGRMDILSADTKASDSVMAETAHSASAMELPFHEACDMFEKVYIEKAIATANGSIAKASELLGIHRSLLYKKIKKYHINQ